MLVGARSYVPLVRELAKTQRCLVLELPGSGRASRVSETWHLERYAAFLARALDALGVEADTLVGHSNSGPVAALACAVPSPRAKRLVLVDTIGSRATPSLPRVVVSRAIDALQEPLFDVRAGRDIVRNMVRHRRNFLAQVRLAGSLDHLPGSRRIRVPTLVAWGRRDGTMPKNGGKRLAQAIESAELFVGPGGHDWLVTHPRAFSRAIASFTRS
jgi:pimeloyl-ACP methyl ester carboxylesterase